MKRADVVKLRRAIAKHKAELLKVDARAGEALQRLYPKAAAAFAKLTEKPCQVHDSHGCIEFQVLQCCVEAHTLWQGYPKKVEQNERLARRFADDKAAADRLRGLLRDVSRPAVPGLAARLPADLIDDADAGLLALDYIIAHQQRIIAEDEPRLHITRKAKADGQRVAAGVHWLAAGIARLTGRPHRPEVAALARLVFGDPTVSEDRVRRATRAQV